MARFQAIHVSDFHFGRRGGRPNVATLVENPEGAVTAGRVWSSLRGFHRQVTHDPDVALQVARFLVERVRPGSLLLVSGDVAATGLDADLAVGLAFLCEPPGAMGRHLTASLKPTIAGARLNVCLVPGNHDRYRSDLGIPGSTAFDRKFQAFWGDPNPSVVAKVVLHEDGETKLAVVAADLCLAQGDWSATSWGHYGHGRATARVIDLLATRTSALRDRHPGVGVVWMLHFPPALKDGDVPASLRLIDQQLVTDAASRMDVRLILAGHTHRSAVTTSGDLTVACAGSATFFMATRGHYIHEVEIDVDGGIATLAARSDHRWDDVFGGFVEVARA